MNWYALLAVLAVVGAYSAIKDIAEHSPYPPDSYTRGSASYTQDFKYYRCTEQPDSKGC